MEFTNPNGSKVVFNLNDVRSCVAEGTGSYLFTRTGSGKTQVQESPATIALNSCGNIVLFTVYSPLNQYNTTKQMGVNPNYVVGVVSNTSGNGVLKMITPTENFTTTSTYNAAVALLSICVSGGGGGGGSLTNTYVGFGDGLNQLDGEAGFTYDAESNRLAVDTVKTKRITSKSGSLEILNDTKFNAYPNTRDDSGAAVNFFNTDVSGNLRSDPVSSFFTDLPAQNGLSNNAGDIELGQSIGASGDPAELTSDREIPSGGHSIAVKGIIGSELIVDGSFSNIATNWPITATSYAGITNPSAWTAGGGGVNQNPARSASGYRDRLSQSVALTNGDLYRVSFVVTNYVAGGISIDVGGMFSKIATENGTFTDYIRAAGDDMVSIQAFTGCNLTVSSLSVKPVTEADLRVEGDITAERDINIKGIINTGNNNRVLIGYWKDGLDFGMSNWHPYENGQPSVSIGQESMKFGSGVAIGPLAGQNNSNLGYITAVGVGTLKDNTDGHATGFGTGAGQNNTTGDLAAFGDEACASSTTSDNVGGGYYTLNQATSDGNAVWGHQGARLTTTGVVNGVGHEIAYNNTTGTVTGFGNHFAYNNTTGTVTGGGHLSLTEGQYNYRMTVLGDNIASNSPNHADRDSNGVMIGYGIGRGVAATTPLKNYIAIGSGSTVSKSNQAVFGNSAFEENLFFGKIGLNTSPSYAYTIQVNSNGVDGVLVSNVNSGTSATVGFDMSMLGGIDSYIRQYNPSHPVWPASLVFSGDDNNTGGMNLYQNGANPIRLFTNGTQRLKVSGNGNSYFGSNASYDATEKLEVAGAIKAVPTAGTLTRIWGDTGDGVVKYETPASIIGASLAQPANQVVYGNTTGVTSHADYTYTRVAGASSLNLQGNGSGGWNARVRLLNKGTADFRGTGVQFADDSPNEWAVGRFYSENRFRIAYNSASSDGDFIPANYNAVMSFGTNRQARLEAYTSSSSFTLGSPVGSFLFDAAGNIGTSGLPVTAIAPVGSTPNANAATITGSTLNLEPASATHKGVISLTQLKFPLKMTVVDGNTDVPGAGLQTYEVIRIPACYDGYSISDVSYGVWKTGATGTAEMQIRRNGSGTAGVTFTAGQAVKDVTLTGVTVSTGDLIDVEIISNSMATPQQGLWVTIFLTPH